MKSFLKESPSLDLGVIDKALKSPQTRKKKFHIAKIGSVTTPENCIEF